MPQNEKPIRQRHEMVERQIIARGVRDEEVLRAMRKVPRHLFVPESFRRLAYADEPLPIGEDQTISQPYIVAYMTEALRLKGGERVLEIGTGSGYQAAVLAEIADSVFTIEIVPALADRAAETLADLGYDNVRCLKGDGTYGWPEKAPFDAIMVTAAPPSIPSALSEQLKEGGRMIIPVGTWYQELILVTRKNGALRKERLIPVRFVPMTGDSRKKE
ncbi:MAG TPA: protein-L-isoaspartate(D-aspartate) O-methyltransferase [bacterium]|nr:protein-L-isoaspartate(D-aspartate) O-methyltransferase [bacterium]